MILIQLTAVHDGQAFITNLAHVERMIPGKWGENNANQGTVICFASGDTVTVKEPEAHIRYEIARMFQQPAPSLQRV